MKNGNTIEHSEDEMPLLASSATRAAFKKGLKAGNSVLVSQNGGIYKALPDGTFEFVKKGRPPIKMKKGEIIEIK